MKAITLYDVAQAAGVSYQTVSRVINQAEHVSARTREKVQRAMTELNYVPNRGAQLLAGKRQPTLGLISADLALHAPSQIASAVKRRASERGYAVLISMVTHYAEADCREALQEMLAQRVDGLIVNLPLEDEAAQRLSVLAAPLPVLFLDVSEQAQVNSLVFSPTQGAELGVAHLLEQGHSRIALLAGPKSSVSARARLQGWQHALAQAGSEACAIASGDWSAQSGYEKAHSLLADAVRPDAILVANDQMALGVLRACAEKGIAVPRQLSVVGYDDTMDSAWFTPPLTTVRQAFRAAGEQGVDWLIGEHDPQRLSQTRLPVTLIVRGSTAVAGSESTDDLASRLQELAAFADKLGLR
ncbi:LacI family DNA-binding transcriptional regulator [Enterobacter sp. CC120223-11]|uniref:LacI family DNA-binding transcriptional regulator n=1 Tax=Enterobacter sp. CC120223-11 TaxID=1378073 RepID=UPI000BC8742A|nr:LacI family DNA-binding transcriptional regulator [Enterobacter sp. CC120223-11]SNY61967.1 transcriptional regulator, LacI family [Enterobacter sp. CC120223-11]